MVSNSKGAVKPPQLTVHTTSLLKNWTGSNAGEVTPGSSGCRISLSPNSCSREGRRTAFIQPEMNTKGVTKL